jgi:hypothetical protein
MEDSMTSDPDPDELRHIAEQVVRHIATETGFTTIATIGVGADGMPIVTRSSFTARHMAARYGDLLDVFADHTRRHPPGVPAYACALIAPERDIAYLHHDQAGAELAQVLTIGRSPDPDAATHIEVSRGLAALMAALTDTQPPHRPTGHAFLHRPDAQAVLLPPTPPTLPPDQPGHHR